VVGDNYLGRRIASPESVTPRWLSLALSFNNDFPAAIVLDSFLNPLSMLFGVASRTRPPAIDTRVRCEPHGRFAVRG